VIGVHQPNCLPFRAEREGCLVASDALIGEILEDLFEGRLLHTILLDTQVISFLLELAEEPSDGFAFFWHSKFKEFAALF